MFSRSRRREPPTPGWPGWTARELVDRRMRADGWCGACKRGCSVDLRRLVRSGLADRPLRGMALVCRRCGARLELVYGGPRDNLTEASPKPRASS